MRLNGYAFSEGGSNWIEDQFREYTTRQSGIAPDIIEHCIRILALAALMTSTGSLGLCRIVKGSELRLTQRFTTLTMHDHRYISLTRHQERNHHLVRIFVHLLLRPTGDRPVCMVQFFTPHFLNSADRPLHHHLALARRR